MEKVLGNFDGRGCLGKVLARLHASLPGGLGEDWCLEEEKRMRAWPIGGKKKHPRPMVAQIAQRPPVMGHSKEEAVQREVDHQEREEAQGAQGAGGCC